MTKVSFGKIFIAALLAGMLLVFLAVVSAVLFVIAIASSADQKAELNDNSILKIVLKGELEDQTQPPSLMKMIEEEDNMPVLGLFDLQTCIRSAAGDDRIDALYLELFGFGAGMAQMEELRETLEAFKKSGKPIYCYSDHLNIATFYLTSVADKIMLYPEAVTEIKGLRTQILFLEEALSNLGIKMQVIRHGSFKSAGETFMRNDLSEENREQITRFQQQVLGVLGEGIKGSRNRSEQELDQLLDQVIQVAPELVAGGWVDTLVYQNELNETVEALVGNDVHFIAPHAYMDHIEREGDEVGLIYVQGAIPHGNGGRDDVDVESVIGELNYARDHDRIKAVVMRVNSPGGSALFSDKIWRAVQSCSAKKPLLVSMGNVAASGGYYISVPANKIFVDKNTLTGSIGVFSMIPDASELLKDKWHLNFDSVMTHSGADMGTATRSMTNEERYRFQKMVDHIYTTFSGKVEAGRGLSTSEVEALAQGRIWSGQDAVDQGLADQIGGLMTTLDSAAAMAGLGQYQVVELPTLDPFKSFMKSLMGNVSLLESDPLERIESTVENKVLELKNPQVRLPFELVNW